MRDIIEELSEISDIEFEKCGEIIVAPRKNVFAMTCLCCQDIFVYMTEFMRHVRTEHGDELHFNRPNIAVYDVDDLIDNEKKLPEEDEISIYEQDESIQEDYFETTFIEQHGEEIENNKESENKDNTDGNQANVAMVSKQLDNAQKLLKTSKEEVKESAEHSTSLKESANSQAIEDNSKTFKVSLADNDVASDDSDFESEMECEYEKDSDLPLAAENSGNVKENIKHLDDETTEPAETEEDNEENPDLTALLDELDVDELDCSINLEAIRNLTKRKHKQEAAQNIPNAETPRTSKPFAKMNTIEEDELSNLESILESDEEVEEAKENAKEKEDENKLETENDEMKSEEKQEEENTDEHEQIDINPNIEPSNIDSQKDATEIFGSPLKEANEFHVQSTEIPKTNEDEMEKLSVEDDDFNSSDEEDDLQQTVVLKTNFIPQIKAGTKQEEKKSAIIAPQMANSQQELLKPHAEVINKSSELTSEPKLGKSSSKTKRFAPLKEDNSDYWSKESLTPKSTPSRRKSICADLSDMQGAATKQVAKVPPARRKSTAEYLPALSEIDDPYEISSPFRKREIKTYKTPSKKRSEQQDYELEKSAKKSLNEKLNEAASEPITTTTKGRKVTERDAEGSPEQQQHRTKMYKTSKILTESLTPRSQKLQETRQLRRTPRRQETELNKQKTKENCPPSPKNNLIANKEFVSPSTCLIKRNLVVKLNKLSPEHINSAKSNGILHEQAYLEQLKAENHKAVPIDSETPSKCNYVKQNFTEKSLSKQSSSEKECTKNERTPLHAGLDAKSLNLNRTAHKKQVMQRMQSIKKRIFKSLESDVSSKTSDILRVITANNDVTLTKNPFQRFNNMNKDLKSAAKVTKVEQLPNVKIEKSSPIVVGNGVVITPKASDEGFKKPCNIFNNKSPMNNIKNEPVTPSTSAPNGVATEKSAFINMKQEPITPSVSNKDNVACKPGLKSENKTPVPNSPSLANEEHPNKSNETPTVKSSESSEDLIEDLLVQVVSFQKS